METSRDGFEPKRRTAKNGGSTLDQNKGTVKRTACLFPSTRNDKEKSMDPAMFSKAAASAQPYSLPSTINSTAIPSSSTSNLVHMQQHAQEDDRVRSKKELELEGKDLELGELLEKMDEWKSIIPDEVTDYYLQRAGFETSDVRV